MDFVTPTDYPHVVLNEQGRPQIAGSRMKVQHLAVAHIQHGWSPQELHWQFPDLSLAEIHAALAYYYDHRQELDSQAEESAEWLRQLGRQADPAVMQLIRQRKLARASGS